MGISRLGAQRRFIALWRAITNGRSRPVIRLSRIWLSIGISGKFQVPARNEYRVRLRLQPISGLPVSAIDSLIVEGLSAAEFYMFVYGSANVKTVFSDFICLSRSSRAGTLCAGGSTVPVVLRYVFEWK
jgi:hypothetical protein